MKFTTKYPMKFTITFVALYVAVATSAPTPGLCPIKAFQAGYDLAKNTFDSNWDKNCTTLTNDFYENLLTGSPTLKCEKRGYYSGMYKIYNRASEACFPNCKGVGKVVGLELGKMFCKGQIPKGLDTTCNAVEEASCSDTFFDYTFANCDDKRRVDDYSKYFMYMDKWC